MFSGWRKCFSSCKPCCLGATRTTRQFAPSLQSRVCYCRTRARYANGRRCGARKCSTRDRRPQNVGAHFHQSLETLARRSAAISLHKSIAMYRTRTKVHRRVAPNARLRRSSSGKRRHMPHVHANFDDNQRAQINAAFCRGANSKSANAKYAKRSNDAPFSLISSCARVYASKRMRLTSRASASNAAYISSAQKRLSRRLISKTSQAQVVAALAATQSESVNARAKRQPAIRTAVS